MSRENWVDFAGTYEAVVNNPLIAIEFFETVAMDRMTQFENYINPLTIKRKEELAALAEKALENLNKAEALPKTEYDSLIGTIKEMKKKEVIDEKPKEEPVGEMKNG